MNVITLTLNPAFDIHCKCDGFRPYSESLATVSSRSAGGKGVNISRALINNGVESVALTVLGKENAEDFLASLSKHGISPLVIFTEGRIRENITVHTSGMPETRISFSTPSVGDALIDEVESLLSTHTSSDSVITLTGSLPNGVTPTRVKKMLENLKNKGAKLVIDSKSFTLSDLAECKPWLIKPNEEEIAAYLGKTLSGITEAAIEAKALYALGIENVIISLGEKGAALASKEGAYIATAPKVDVLSTVGAGDSMIAGFLAAKKSGLSSPDALRHAVAYGTAACMSEGTEPPDGENIDALFECIEITRL